MTLIKTRFLNKTRKELETKGYTITDEQWKRIVSQLESEIESKLKVALNNRIFLSEDIKKQGSEK